MAGNITLNSGSGGSTLATDEATVNGATAEIQYTKIMDGTAGSAAVIPGDATNGLYVNVKAGTVTANAGSGTFNIQQSNVTSDYDTGVGTQTMTMFGLALPASGGSVAGGTATNPVRTDPTGTTTQPVSGTVTVTQSTASNLKVDLSGTAANATAIKVDGSAVTQPVSGTVTANAGTGTFNTSATQSGTWTVQPGNTANTTPWMVSQVPATSGGLSNYHLVSAATTNATNIKASAGQVFGWFIYNSNAAARKIAFHNTSGSPTAGASVFMSVVIPPSSAANVFSESGIAFSTGIAITTVTGLADSDATAVGSNDLVINIFYK